MQEHTGYFPGPSPVEGKQVQAAFDGGLLSSDAGVLLLREAERPLRFPNHVDAGLDGTLRSRLVCRASRPSGER